MTLSDQVMKALKEAMKAKDQNAMTSLRAVKSAILLTQTEAGANEGLTQQQEIKLLQKLVKQRKDSARIFMEQDRSDLAQPELDQAAVIEKFLPEQLETEELTAIIQEIVTQTGASSMKDMGKVMGMVNAKVQGKADSAAIASIVKGLLN